MSYILAVCPLLLAPADIEARLEIEALYDGTDFSETLTRARFEETSPVSQRGVRNGEDPQADDAVGEE